MATKSNCKAVTHSIDIDEDCYGYYELDYQAPNYEGFHRYRIIIVKRGDSPAEYCEDMGSSDKFKGQDMLRIATSVVEGGRVVSLYKIGEVLEIANEYWLQAHIDLCDIIGVNKINKG